MTVILKGFTVVEYEKSVQTVAVQMVHNVMDTNQEEVEALELIFEDAVEQAREFLRESIHG